MVSPRKSFTVKPQNSNRISWLTIMRAIMANAVTTSLAIRPAKSLGRPVLNQSQEQSEDHHKTWKLENFLTSLIGLHSYCTPACLSIKLRYNCTLYSAANDSSSRRECIHWGHFVIAPSLSILGGGKVYIRPKWPSLTAWISGECLPFQRTVK